MSAETAHQTQRGLTVRSFVIAIVALFAMGVWIEYEELYCFYGGPLAENSPPNSAVGVILGLLLISALLYKLRRPLRLVPAELVVIYSALVLAAPLMTQGMWHRFFGLVAALPHNQDFKSYQSLPRMLWPHGPNLVTNPRFAEQLAGFRHTGGGTVTWTNALVHGRDVRPSPVLSNAGDPQAQATLEWTIFRYDDRGREVLVPGESFLFSMLVKAEGFTRESVYAVRLQADDGPAQPLILTAEETKPSYALPGGFKRVGLYPVRIPTDLKDRLTFRVGLSGDGRLTVQDLEFMNVEAVAGAYAGRRVVTESEWAKLPESERDFTLVRPDNLWSWAGVKYLVTGFIPLSQWREPAIAWGVLIGALFIGFLGMNLLMRKQWVEHERFTFPLTILPKVLFEEQAGADGKLFRPIFRNRVMWAAFAVTLGLALLKGLNYYFPGVPSPDVNIATFGDYVTSPVLKAFLKNVGVGVGSQIGLSLCILAIALLIETDILFSLWSMFLIFQLWHLFGRAFNFTRYAGYPWEFEQATGAFIAYGILALIVGRHHLARVGRIIFGREKNAAPEDVGTYRLAIGLVLAALAALIGWGIWTRIGGGASLIFFGYLILTGFAASKIRAECGAPFGYLTPYIGMYVMMALGGFAVFGSAAMLVVTLASGFMCTSVFLLIAPVQVEMMELGRHFKVRPRDIGAGLTLGLLGGLFIGGFVLLCWLYGFGANNLKTAWPYEQNWYFNNFRPHDANADRAFLAGTLGELSWTRPGEWFQHTDLKGLSIGAVITVVMTVMRVKFMWFPFHPLGYVLASSYLMRNIWFACFLAWCVRQLVFRIGGAQVIRRGLVPVAVGMFLACVASIVIFDVVGIYLRTQGVQEVYSRMP